MDLDGFYPPLQDRDNWRWPRSRPGFQPLHLADKRQDDKVLRDRGDAAANRFLRAAAAKA